MINTLVWFVASYLNGERNRSDSLDTKSLLSRGLRSSIGSLTSVDAAKAATDSVYSGSCTLVSTASDVTDSRLVNLPRDFVMGEDFFVTKKLFHHFEEIQALVLTISVETL